MPLAAVPMLLLFALTLFVSATLLFLVQPMIGKLLLPMLGGTPAVWNTCMVFFQALLLAGYAYAHASTAWLGARRQAALHLVVLLLPFLTISLTVDRGLLEYGEGSPIPGLLLALFISVGLPFFVVSSTAPLLQTWFAGTGHPAAKDPYFLYGASNLGSMLALFSYPAVVEPNMTLAGQRFLWQVGYGVLVVLIALCAVVLWRSSGANKEFVPVSEYTGEDSLGGKAGSVSLSQRLRWIALAFVPSSLMLGVTTYMTTDIAAIPLLWVLPLGLYLLSFIFVFSRMPAVVHRLMVGILPFIVLALVFLMLSEFSLRIWWKIAIHLAVLFVISMVCHGELARDRPVTRYLTGFYLCMSLGGVLGGIFNALVAPVVFNGIVEYPLALILACLLAPTLERLATDEARRAWAMRERPTPAAPSAVPGAITMGFYLGVGVALLIAALGRSDLNVQALAGADGLWLLAAVAVAPLLAGLPAFRANDRSARWLDFGLPAALGVLAIGLSLGLRVNVMHVWLDRLFFSLYESVRPWLSPQFARLLNPYYTGYLLLLIYIVPIVLCAFFMNRPRRFALGIAALFLANSFCDLLDEDVLLRQRSFFGVLYVRDDAPFRRLEHGTTLHGQQRLRWSRATLAASAVSPFAAGDPLGVAFLAVSAQDVATHPGREPQTYFHRTGPLGQIFAAYDDKFAGKEIGLIGLGSGTIATYGQPGQHVTYYEIDPLVKHIAYDPKYFTFIQDARQRNVQLDLVLGDARLKLEERAHNPASPKLALLVVDAFSSDAIPIHLITREAMKIYLDNLAEDGIVAFHISNRYLDLDPVLGNLAKEMGLTGYIEADNDNRIPGKASSNWVALARKRETLDRLIHEDRWEEWKKQNRWADHQQAVLALSALTNGYGAVNATGPTYGTALERLQPPWRKLKVRPEVGVWSDDYSNLLSVFEW